jgi:endonuclease/exonuclease/phosphatase family metal-dependent hydrolase
VRLRVATFNIHHGVGTDGRLDLGRTADVVAATGAAVVGLQEVDRTMSARSGWTDQAAWLGERLGMDVVHGATVDRGPPPGSPAGAPARRYGNALRSGHPVRSWRALRLPGGGRREPRGVIDAVVDVDGVAMRCAVTHLQNRSRAERLAQAAHLLDLLAAVDGPAEPTVLLGDLNAGPDSPELRLLTTVLVDVWAAVGRGRGDTFEARHPLARIDHVLVGGPVTPVAAEVVDSRASDHRPVVADLDVAAAGAGGPLPR